MKLVRWTCYRIRIEYSIRLTICPALPPTSRRRCLGLSSSPERLGRRRPGGLAAGPERRRPRPAERRPTSVTTGLSAHGARSERRLRRPRRVIECCRLPTSSSWIPTDRLARFKAGSFSEAKQYWEVGTTTDRCRRSSPASFRRKHSATALAKVWMHTHAHVYGK